MPNIAPIRSDRQLYSSHGYNASIAAASWELMDTLQCDSRFKLIIHAVSVFQIADAVANLAPTGLQCRFHTGAVGAEEQYLFEFGTTIYEPTQRFKIPKVINAVGPVNLSAYNQLAAVPCTKVHSYIFYEKVQQV